MTQKIEPRRIQKTDELKRLEREQDNLALEGSKLNMLQQEFKKKKDQNEVDRLNIVFGGKCFMKEFYDGHRIFRRIICASMSWPSPKYCFEEIKTNIDRIPESFGFIYEDTEKFNPYTCDSQELIYIEIGRKRFNKELMRLIDHLHKQIETK